MHIAFGYVSDPFGLKAAAGVCLRIAAIIGLTFISGVLSFAQQIKVYPANLRVEIGKTATFTALAFDTQGNYVHNQVFSFERSSGPANVASVRRSPEGDTEEANSRLSKNLAEVKGLAAGTITYVARVGSTVSQPVTVTVTDPDAAPTAVITEDSEAGQPITVLVGDAIEVSAESSGGTKNVEWFWGDGDRTGDLLSASHAYLIPATYLLKLRVTNGLGQIAESSISVVVSPFPAPTRTFTVTTVAQLLAAYNQCTGGEHIIIPAGTVIAGQVELPARSFTDFVTIRSSAAMPEMPIRVTQRDPGFAVIRGSYPNEIPFIIKDRASKIRLSGIKFEPFHGTDDSIQNYYLLQIGEPNTQRSTEDNPSHIILDHCIVNPPDDLQVVHAVLNDGYKVSVVSSWLGNIRTFGGQDSQAVFSLDARGAHVYNNTYFEAASESVIYGGSANSIEGNVPTNIEFRRCTFAKPLGWRNLPPNSVGATINIKNLFETKNARRVYLEGSIFLNQWDAGRSQYFAFVIKSTADHPVGEDQGSSWARSEDIVFENNRLSHANGVMAVAREFNGGGEEYDPLKPRNIRLVNMLFDDITFGRWGETRTWAFHISGVDDFSVRHATMIDAIDTPDESQETLLSLGSINTYRPDIRDSILPLNYYGIRNTCGEGIAALNVASSGWFDPATRDSCGAVAGGNAGQWSVNGNVLPKLRSQPVTGNYPANNVYPDDFAQVGMVHYRNCSVLPSDPCDSLLGDFALRPDSPYRNTASDHSDPGIDAVLLAERLRCTSSGDTRTCITAPGIATPTPTPAGIEGDLATRPDGDGAVLTNDLTLLRGFVSGLLIPTPGSNEFQRADIAPYATRGDSQLTASDIAQMRNYISGFNPLTPAGGPTGPVTGSREAHDASVNKEAALEITWPPRLFRWF